MTLSAKRILLTGGTTGIGRAMLIALARQGARIVTMGRDPEALDEALGHARGEGGELHGIVADLAKAEEIERVFAEVDAKLGGVDIVISNAAIGAEPIDEMEDAAWRYAVDVNLLGALGCVRGALKRMDKGGQVLIVGSISAEIHGVGESVYSATKAGLQAFALTLRKEVEERGIRVSLIEPGSVGTDMQESSSKEQRGKIAREEMLAAEDIADAAIFVLDRPARVDVVSLRIEPRIQKLK